MGMKGKKMMVFIIEKNKVFNKRAKELMSLSDGDKFLTVYSADLYYIFRLNFGLRLLILDYIPIYI